MNMTALAAASLAAAGIALISIVIASYLNEAEFEARVARLGSRGGKRGTGRLPSASLIGSSRKALVWVNRSLEERSFGAHLARDIARADLRVKVSEFIVLWVASTAAVPLVMIVVSAAFPALRSPLALLIGGGLGAAVPPAWLSRRQRARLNAFNRQLPDTIVLIANSLRAGSSFLQASELVSRESPQPTADEFERLVREINLGLSFDEALDNMVRRLKSPDLELVVTAIAIQHQVGGNLAEVLDSITMTIRERIRIKGEIRTLTAQQRLSGIVVGSLPIVMIGFLVVAFPKYLAPMFASSPSILGIPAGVVMLSVGGLMMVSGFYLIRRIMDIDV